MNKLLITVRDIVLEWLTTHGYDALCNDGCGCSIDDFMPCCYGENIESCEPGRRIIVTKEDAEYFDNDENSCDYEIGQELFVSDNLYKILRGGE